MAALSVTGFLLITYLVGEKETQGYRLSSIAGYAALGVAFLPTKRIDAKDPLCGPDTLPKPEDCTQLQQTIGETCVATAHFICAGIFILALAAICLRVFAPSERDARNVGRAHIHRICGYVILAAILWVALGAFLPLQIGPFTPLFVGEVVSVYAFAVSWFVKGQDLMKSVPVLRRVFLFKAVSTHMAL